MKSHIGLTARSCSPASELALMEEKERDLLKQQVPGWKVRHYTSQVPLRAS